MKMYLISDNTDTRAGMRLAGIEGEVVHGREELRRALQTALDDPDLGILLLTEKLAALAPDLIDEIRLKRRQPLLVEIPDRHGTGRSKDFITSYISQAIGLKV